MRSRGSDLATPEDEECGLVTRARFFRAKAREELKI